MAHRWTGIIKNDAVKREVMDTTFTVNIFDIVEILLIASGILGAYYKIDKRLVLVEARQIVTENEMKRIDNSVDRKLTSIDKKLDDLTAAVSMMKGQHLK